MLIFSLSIPLKLSKFRTMILHKSTQTRNDITVKLGFNEHLVITNTRL